MTNVVFTGQVSKTTESIDIGACDCCPRSKDESKVKIGPNNEILSFCKAVGDFVSVRKDIKSFEDCPKYSPGLFSHKVNKT